MDTWDSGEVRRRVENGGRGWRKEGAREGGRGDGRGEGGGGGGGGGGEKRGGEGGGVVDDKRIACLTSGFLKGGTSE